MKKYRVYVIVALILSSLVFIKAKFFTVDKSKALGKGKDGKRPATPVSVFVVGSDQLENKIYASGTILANEETELRSEATGRITYLNLPEGKAVRAGTLLLKVNDAELKAQLEKINVQLKLASDNEYRQRKLLEINAISKQEYEIAYTSYAALKADSINVRAQIAKTELYAPYTGIIGIRNVSPGSYITSANVTAVIHQLDPIKIEFTLPEKYASLFKVGDKIQFQTEGIAEVFEGRIEVKDPSVDLTSRSVRFRAKSNNSKGLLLPGAFAKVELIVKQNGKTLFVPTEAIVPVAKGKKLFLVKNGIAKEKMVETGLRTEDYLQVLSGLEVGDSVVVNGNFQLKNDSEVKVSKPRKK